MIYVIAINSSIGAFILTRQLVLYEDERKAVMGSFQEFHMIAFVPFVLFTLVFTSAAWPWILYRSLIGKSVLKGDS